MKPKFQRDLAMMVADELVAELLPHVEQIEIAGSLRRGKAEVGDIEILFVPKIIQTRDGLFGSKPFDLAAAHIDALEQTKHVIQKRPAKNGIFAWGPLNKLAIHSATGIPVDFFSTVSENWFVSLVIRTGSKETNLRLTTGAQKLNRKLHAYGGGTTEHKSGELVLATSERHVFELCGVPYLEPQCR